MMRQNPILPKKKGSRFYKCNFSMLRALIARQNPFPQKKNSSNGRRTLNRNDTAKNECAVTSNHA